MNWTTSRKMRLLRVKLYHTRVEHVRWNRLLASRRGEFGKDCAATQFRARHVSYLSVLVIVRRKYGISSNDFAVTPLPRLYHNGRVIPFNTEQSSQSVVPMRCDYRTYENPGKQTLVRWKISSVNALIYCDTVTSRFLVRSNPGWAALVSYSTSSHHCS